MCWECVTFPVIVILDHPCYQGNHTVALGHPCDIKNRVGKCFVLRVFCVVLLRRLLLLALDNLRAPRHVCATATGPPEEAGAQSSIETTTPTTPIMAGASTAARPGDVLSEFFCSNVSDSFLSDVESLVELSPLVVITMLSNARLHGMSELSPGGRSPSC
jgi:hypothetical protein